MSSRLLLQCLTRRNLIHSQNKEQKVVTSLEGVSPFRPFNPLISHKRRFHCSTSLLGKRVMPVIPAVVANRHNLCLHTPITLGNYCGSYGFYSGAHGCGAPMTSYSMLSSPSKSPFFESKNGLLIGTRRNGILPDKRYYAKGKDKPKGKKTQVTVNIAEMNEVVDAEALKAALLKQVDLMKEDFTKQLSVRGSSGLEQLKVEFEGEVYPLQELSQVGRKNPQLAVLSLASLPDAIPSVLKAISNSGMNLNPQQEGTTIYVPLPKVTREHRETMAKNAKAIYMKYKTNLQAVQNKFIKQCKGQKEISEDLCFSVSQQIMKLTEGYILELEGILESKQKELLETL